MVNSKTYVKGFGSEEYVGRKVTIFTEFEIETFQQKGITARNFRVSCIIAVRLQLFLRTEHFPVEFSSDRRTCHTIRIQISCNGPESPPFAIEMYTLV